MKLILITALFLSSIPAFSAKVRDAKCSDIAPGNEKITPQFLAVIDGYDKAGKKVSEEIDMENIVTDSKKVNAECAKDRTAKIDSIRKEIRNSKVQNTAKTAAINPMKAKCEDFLLLGEEVQPVAAFWVAGHDKSGKLKKGEIDEEFLARPIVTLIEECKARPKTSFYEKTKAWIKKHT